MSTLRSFIYVVSAFVILGLKAEAQIVISEIHYHPIEEPVFNSDGTPFLNLTNDVHEFIEIQNTGASIVDMAGWSLGGCISFVFPTNTTIAPGAFRVIAKNPSRLATVYSLTESDVLGPYDGYLGNGKATVRLRDASANTIDSVSYSSEFPWAQVADAFGAADRFTGLTSTNYQYKGRSLQRVSVTWPSNDPANWLASPLSGPTPGAAQAVTRTIPKPVVTAFSAVQSTDSATIIRSNTPVTVNCTFSGTNSLSLVTLEYFSDNINSTTETHTNVLMTDLGTGQYEATIPGHTNRSIVRYRFLADRGDGLEVVSPREDDPQIAPVGTNGAVEAWYGYFVTPVRTSTNAAIHDIFVSSTSLTKMANNISQSPNRVTASSATGVPRDIPYVAATAPQWNGTVPGIFACDGKIWDIQIRYHGSRYHRSSSTLSYKVHFPSHQPYNGRTSWFETLHGAEFIEAQKLNRMIGLPASKMRFVDWYFNTSANNVHSEQGEYDGDMLDDYHKLQQQLNPGTEREETGDLYKDVGNRDSSQNNTEGPYTRGDEAPMLANSKWSQLDRYAWTFTIQNNDWKGPKPLRDLLEGMWTARGDTISTHNFTNSATQFANAKAWFSNNWDIDTTLTSMALLEWMSIWDDAAQNHFFWRRANGKWSRLGWDYDGVMSTSSSGGGGGPGGGGGGGGSGGYYNQTIYGGEYGATTVFDGVNWWKDTFYKCFRTEYQKRLWELNNSFLDPTNLSALGFTTAATFAKSRRTYVNSLLSSFGTYYKPERPTNTYPANGAKIVGNTNLVISDYSHSQSASQYSTKWEIRTSTGDYEEPLIRVTSTNYLKSYPIPFDQLTYGQTYYWRATYIDTNGHSSIVSAETMFTWGTASSTAGTLVLNEILAYNHSAVQNSGDYSDYIELRNNGSVDLSLDGYSLTDNSLEPSKYTFPSGTTIPADGYLIVWCDKDTDANGLHSGFGLDDSGETILLMNGSTIVDSVTFGPQAPNVSIGRIANGTGGWQSNTPTPGEPNSAKTLGAITNLRVNEWMANPAYGDDWFEIYNCDTNVVSLAGLYLSDTPSTPKITQIPALSFIAGNGHLKFSADGSTSGGTHANFKLNNNGESILITASDGVTTIDSVTFAAQKKDVSQGRLPDGASTIVSFSSQTASPGYANWQPASVYINEVLANSVTPFEDAIEIYNPTTNAVDIGGWWLSDDILIPKKYQIPAATSVPAHGFKVIYEYDLLTADIPFALSAHGDDVLLSATDSNGAFTGSASYIHFGVSAPNVSLGRITATGLSATSGGVDFWPLISHSFGEDNPSDTVDFRTGTGGTNASPKIGPIVINEIMYHPTDYSDTTDDTQDEFIELYNLTSSSVDLSDWHVKGDTEFTFPSGSSLAGNAYVLLVSFNPTNTTILAAFRATNGVSSSTPIFGPYSSKLPNSTADIEIAFPTNFNGSTSYVVMDKVEYRDIEPWATNADGGGKSLQRTNLTMIGNTAAAWTGATPTPGAINVGITTNAISITTDSTLPGGIVGTAYSITFAADGGTPPYKWTSTSGSVPGLTFSTNGTLSGTPTTAGTYTIIIAVTDSLTNSVEKSFGLTMASSALTISTESTLPDVTINTAYSETLEATGGTPPYTWTQTAGNLPGGTKFNGAGVLSGTPTNLGTFTFTAQVEDNGGLSASAEFTVTVSAQALTITTLSPLVAAIQGSLYSQALTSAGGVAPYKWSVSSGSLPSGVALSETGDLSGIPTSSGVFSFTVSLTDSLNNSTSKMLSLTVTSPTLLITTTELPDCVYGIAYSQQLTASGGTTPYTWTVSEGEVPDGLTLKESGLLSGTPTNAGTYSFTIKVTDSQGISTTEFFTVMISNNLPTILVERYSDNAVQFTISGDAGANLSIDASTDLDDWSEIFNTNAPAEPFTWIDNGNTNQYRFYRVILNSTH